MERGGTRFPESPPPPANLKKEKFLHVGGGDEEGRACLGKGAIIGGRGARTGRVRVCGRGRALRPEAACVQL